MTDNNLEIEHKHGVLGVDYAQGRTSNRALKYRLRRRTHEVKEAIRAFLPVQPNAIIDLGTAEGRMLNELQNAFPGSRCIGIEYSGDLVAMAKRLFPSLDVRQGDVHNLAPLPAGEFDVAVATAVIEHLANPEAFLQEVKRILRPGGILVMTAPDPFWEHIATMVGHLAAEQHHEVPNLKRLIQLSEGAGLQTLLAQKFMLSPVGLPAEFRLERVMRAIGMSFMMANQLVVGRNPD